MLRIIKAGTALGVALAVASPATVSTASAAPFYEGKTITILIGYGFGGT